MGTSEDGVSVTSPDFHTSLRVWRNLFGGERHGWEGGTGKRTRDISVWNSPPGV